MHGYIVRSTTCKGWSVQRMLEEFTQFGSHTEVESTVGKELDQAKINDISHMRLIKEKRQLHYVSV